MSKKLKIILSGIGNRALPKKPQDSNWTGWVGLLSCSPEFELIAAHDVSEESIKRIIDAGYIKPEQAYQDLDSMLKKTVADAILISNPAEHHAETIRKALDYNLDLLVEKPFVKNSSEGKELADLIEKNGKVAAVVQNWRSKDAGRGIYEAVQNGMLGKIGQIFFRYIRNRENPNYPEYIYAEEYPLLYAMGIHHLDLFRYILNEDYLSVSGHAFKPPWSNYHSDTGMNLFLRTKSGIPIVYSGTISSRNNLIPQESLVIEGVKGTLFNESQWLEPPLWFYPADRKERIDLTEGLRGCSIREQYDIADSRILKNFYNAVRCQEKPICTARDGLQSVAILEASRMACKTGEEVLLE